MALKDYYKILNVKPNAPATAIKQAYRKLAMKYHPDKNAEDVLSAEVFGEIAEAYSVLGNSPARKNYNNQRYYTAKNEYAKTAESIESLLMKATLLKNQVSHADPFRFNRDALLYSIKQLFPADIALLLQTNEMQQKNFLETIMWCSNMLHSIQTKKLIQIMQPLFIKHAWLKQQLENTMQQQLKKEQWEKYKIVLAIIISLLLCAIIFFTTKHIN